MSRHAALKLDGWLTGAAEHAELTAEIAAASGVPCIGRPEWLSDDIADRLEAVEACTRCPVLSACQRAAMAVSPTFGVWHGRDYTRRKP